MSKMALFKDHFYHSLIKRYTTVMGSLFNNINLVRYNPDGTENHRIVVPVAYSPKEKFVQIIEQDQGRKPAITLPRMAFELESMTYDSSRKQQKLQHFRFRNFIRGENGEPDHVSPHAESVYTPVPYDFTYSLYIVTKSLDEMLQIVEQIIPAFNPDVTISMNAISEPQMTFDVPVSLAAISPSDSYEGGLTDRREIIWTLTFSLKGYLFGPLQDKNVILETDISFPWWPGDHPDFHIPKGEKNGG